MLRISTLRQPLRVPPFGPSFAHTMHHTVGYAKGYWEDPIGIDVNSVTSHINFRWDGHCVHNPVTGYTHLGWHSGTGWRRVNDFFGVTADCNLAQNFSYAKFHNGIFCHGASTNTVYNYNEAHGHRNGHIIQVLHSTTTGRCVRFLSRHHVTHRKQVS